MGIEIAMDDRALDRDARTPKQHHKAAHIQLAQKIDRPRACGTLEDSDACHTPGAHHILSHTKPFPPNGNAHCDAVQRHKHSARPLISHTEGRLPIRDGKDEATSPHVRKAERP